jgi:hypothetical protein
LKVRNPAATWSNFIDEVEQAVEPAQRFVDEQPDRTQRVIRRQEIFELGHREQTLLHPDGSAHRFVSVSSLYTASTTNPAQTTFTRGRNSTAC